MIYIFELQYVCAIREKLMLGFEWCSFFLFQYRGLCREGPPYRACEGFKKCKNGNGNHLSEAFNTRGGEMYNFRLKSLFFSETVSRPMVTMDH